MIVGFFILRKLHAYTFFFEDIFRSLIFVIKNHTNILDNFYPEKSQSSLGDMCALREPLGDIGRIEMHALFIIIIIIIIIIVIIIITIIIIIIIIITVTTKPRTIITTVDKNQIYSTYPMFIF